MKRTVASAITFSIALALVGALPASAQTVIATIDGLADGDRLGAIFDAVGDLDGDGVTELIVGHPDDDTMGLDAGRADLRSGATGAVLRTHYGAAPGVRLGETVSNAGDVDGDTIPDYVVGSTVAHFNIGACWVYSGLDGEQLHFLRGTVIGSRFAASIDAAGDLNGDGHDDLVIGAPETDTVHVVSGVDGTPMYVWISSFDPLGSHVWGMGDYDGDNVPDILMGDSRDLGFVMVRSGANGSLIQETWGWGDQCSHGTDGFLGFATTPAGDLDGDGKADFLAGTQYGCPYGSAGRRMQINSAFPFVTAPAGSWPIVQTGPYPQARNAGDIDGDLVPDHVWWVPTTADANAQIGLRSGLAGVLLAPFTSPSSEAQSFGAEIVSLGDTNGDGYHELAVGAPGADLGGSDRGRIYVLDWSGCAAVTRYCSPAVPNDTGASASIDYAGPLSLALGSEATFTVSGLGVGHSGLIIASPDQDSRPLGNGTICLGDQTLGFIVRHGGGLPADGVMTVEMDFENPPIELARITAGSTWYFQAWNRDFIPGGAGFNFSDALSITFCP